MLNGKPRNYSIDPLREDTWHLQQLLMPTWSWVKLTKSDMSKIKDVFFANHESILGLVVLTLAWEDFSDGWIEGDGEEVDGHDGHEEDEELGEGAAGDEEY